MTSSQKPVESEVSAQLLEAARQMAPRIQELSDEIEQTRSLPNELTRQLAHAGFFNMMVAREWGGLETDPITATRVIETLSMANGSAGWVVMIAAGTAFWATALLSDEATREIFSPDAEVIMVGTLGPCGKAVKTDGGYRISGRWPFGSGCQQANWFGSGCWLFDGDEPLEDETGAPAWAMFLTPRNACQIIDTWTVTGLKGTGSHDYTMGEVFVPEHRMFNLRTEENLRPERRYAYPAAVVASMSAVSLGIARGAVDELTRLLQGKRDPLHNRPLSEDLDKQIELAKAEVLVGSSRAYLYEVFEQVWTRVEAGEPLSMELRGRFRGACTNAVLCSVQAVDVVHMAAGSTAIYASSALERCFRDIHTAATHANMRLATLADAGGLLLGVEPLPKLVRF